MPPYERGNVSFVGRDYPKGTGSTYRSCFAVCRWRCVSRRYPGRMGGKAPLAANGHDSTRRGRRTPRALAPRSAHSSRCVAGAGGPGPRFSYILCPNCPPKPYCTKRRIRPEKFLQKSQKNRKNPLDNKGVFDYYRQVRAEGVLHTRKRLHCDEPGDCSARR